MKVTKYEQSCLLIEQDGTRILIDPGFPFTNKHKITELGKLDAVFLTHEHPDHFDQKACEKLMATDQAHKIHVNESTDKLLDTPHKIVVKDKDTIKVGKFEVKVIELPHCLMPDGSEGPQNVGYLINDIFFHPGDGIDLSGLSVKYLALPITGPDVSPKDAFAFAKQVSAEKALAIHYDTWGAFPDYYQDRANATGQPFELVILEPGQSIEIE